MGMTYQECIRARKTEPMNKHEIIDYYASGGEVLPDRYADTEQARRNEITKHYSPHKFER